MSKVQVSLPFQQQQRKRKKRQNIVKDEEYTKLLVSGITVKLPPGIQPYVSQRQMIIRLIQCLKTSSNILIESPTGSGKTLALLSAVCSWLDDYKRQQRIKRNNCPVHGIKVEDVSSSTINTSITENDISTMEKSDVSTVDTKDDFMDDVEFIDANSADMTNTTTTLSADDVVCECLPAIKIYYGTRTHKQISQVVKEYERLPYSRTLKHSILASREQSCLNEEVRSTNDLNGACKELLLPGGKGCLYRNNLKKIDNNPYRMRMIIERNHGDVWDIEELAEAMKSPQLCPYFLSTHVLPISSDIIFTPFNYILDPIIRGATKINLKNAVVILDEAHNVEDTCRDAASFEFKENEFSTALSNFDERLRELREVLVTIPEGGDNDVIINGIKEYKESMYRLSLLAKAIYSLFKTIGTQVLGSREGVKMTHTFRWDETEKLINETKFGDGENLLFNDKDEIREYLHDFKIVVEQKKSEPMIYDYLQRFSLLSVTIVLVEKYLFLMDYYCEKDNRLHYKLNFTFQQPKPEQFTFTQINKFKRNLKSEIKNNIEPILNGYEGVMNLWCMFPSVACTETFKNSHSVILASGTLCPTATLKTELGLNFSADVEGKQTIPNEQIFATIVPKGRLGKKFTCTYSAIDDTFYSELGYLILDVCSVVPKGVLVFVSSYRILEKLREALARPLIRRELEKYKKLFFEPNNSKGLQNVLDDYEAAIRLSPLSKTNGALMIAVYRGKVSEGIDFADDMARCVMCVGIPYPNATDELVKQKKIYNDQNHHIKRILNGNEWYSIQAYRALNQALGRCLRHINDWGAILLVDERYREKTKPDNADYKKISTWVREQVTCFGNYSELMNNLQSFVQKRVQIDAQKSQNKRVNKNEVEDVKENGFNVTNSAAVFRV